MRVTVFGGSRPIPGEAAYEEAFRLGQLLGKSGFTVLTGGYIGTMEAVSRGTFESGGHVIGVTCDEIETWRPVRANKWVMEEIRFKTLRERLFALIDHCDTALALPGGPGTLAEVSVMWSNLLTGAITPRPLILIGPAWNASFMAYFEALGEYIPNDQREWLIFETNVEDAFERVKDIED